MVVDYFPDNDVLLNYFQEYDLDYANSAWLIDNTGDQRGFRGFLTKGITDEFDGATSDNSLSATTQKLMKLADQNKKSNSKPIFISEIKKMDDRYPSQQIVLGLVQYKTKDMKRFDANAVKRSVVEIFDSIKFKRELIKKKLIDCEKNDLYLKAKENNQDKLRALGEKLKVLFPIKKDNDTKDNNHIMDSALHCTITRKPAHFVTCDNLRCYGTFEKNSTQASQEIKSILCVDFFIMKLEQFVRNHKAS